MNSALKSPRDFRQHSQRDHAGHYSTSLPNFLSSFIFWSRSSLSNDFIEQLSSHSVRIFCALPGLPPAHANVLVLVPPYSTHARQRTNQRVTPGLYFSRCFISSNERAAEIEGQSYQMLNSNYLFVYAFVDIVCWKSSGRHCDNSRMKKLICISQFLRMVPNLNSIHRDNWKIRKYFTF